MDRREEIIIFFNKVVRDFMGRTADENYYKAKYKNYSQSYRIFIIKGVTERLERKSIKDKKPYRFGEMDFTRADIWILKEIRENLKTLKELEK